MRRPQYPNTAAKASITRSKPASTQSPCSRVTQRCACVVNALITGISANIAAPTYNCQAHINRFGQMKAASSDAAHA